MRRHPESWRDKIHPAFIEIAELRRALVKAQNQPPSKRAEAVRRVLAAVAEKRDELLRRYPELSPRPSWSHVGGAGYRSLSDGEKLENLLAYYFFKRFRIPLRLAQQKESSGDLNAHDQVVRAKDEFWRLGHGYRVPDYKVSEIHSDLMELGLNHGLQKLTAEELAECFDCVCPCGEEHAADALRRQLGRVKRQLEDALQNSWRLAARRERFSVYGAPGYVARAYHPSAGESYVEISRRGKGLEFIIYADGVSRFSRDSEFNGSQVVSLLPGLFFLQSLEEIFKMFFPGESKETP